MRPTGTKPIVHLELHTGDLAAACAFYEQLCGWPSEQIATAAGPYRALAFDPERGLSGGVVECPVERPLWLPYVDVPDIVAATARARRLGATVLLEPREGPAGWRSVTKAPAGGEVAFWQQKA